MDKVLDLSKPLCTLIGGFFFSVFRAIICLSKTLSLIRF